VPAEHHDHGAVVLLGRCNGVDDAQEIPRDQNVGERLEERREAAILAGRRSKFGSGYFVGPTRDRNRANFR